MWNSLFFFVNRDHDAAIAGDCHLGDRGGNSTVAAIVACKNQFLVDHSLHCFKCPLEELRIVDVRRVIPDLSENLGQG